MFVLGHRSYSTGFLGKQALVYNQAKLNVDAFSNYNKWKRLDLYNADGEDNAQYAKTEGSPD